MALNVARANVQTQEQLLERLLAGVSDSGRTDSLNLPTIAQERAAAQNMINDIEALNQQKNFLTVQLKELEIAKERLTLRAPEDGKILSILQKQGEMIAPSVPVVLLETQRIYYDIYVGEDQAVGLHEGDRLVGTTVADLKQSREKGQADLSAFQVRIYIDPSSGALPGQTIGVQF